MINFQKKILGFTKKEILKFKKEKEKLKGHWWNIRNEKNS